MWELEKMKNPSDGVLQEKDSKGNVLIVDDTLEDLRLLAGILGEQGYRVRAADSGRLALEFVQIQPPDIILADVRMPGMDGYEFCMKLKAGEKTRNIPLIFISALNEVTDKIKGFEAGGVDYISKPFQAGEILARVKNHLALRKAQKKLRWEIEERVKAETALQKAHDELDIRVRQRTAELADAVKKLQSEIIEHESAEERLRKSEAKLNLIIEKFDGFIFTCDQDFRIDYMNASLQKHIGGNGIGENCHKMVFASDGVCPWCPRERVFRGETVRKEIQNSKDGRWYYAIHSPISDVLGNVSKIQTILMDITDRKLAEQELEEKEAYLREENLRLKASLADRYKFGNIVGRSLPMQEVYETILRAGASDAGVVIYGESGTGKELVARSIHENSSRNEKPFVTVNCGAIPESLIESEFFGHKKGAFSGAVSDKHGFLGIADGGTLFLDEIGEIGLHMQVKLLRAIEGGGYSQVGCTDILKPDIRIIAATNRDLKELVIKGEMREDFLYRIHILPLYLPPLRERKEDIPLLVEHFLKKYDPETLPPFSGAVQDAFHGYDWPGNVRELQNTLNRYVSLKKLDFLGKEIGANASRSKSDSLDAVINMDSENKTLPSLVEELEKKLITETLKQHKWRKGKTAKTLGINPRTLYRKMSQYGL